MDIQTSKFNGVQEVPSKEDTSGLETEQVYSSLAYGTGTPPPNTYTHTDIRKPVEKMIWFLEFIWVLWD